MRHFKSSVFGDWLVEPFLVDLPGVETIWGAFNSCSPLLRGTMAKHGIFNQPIAPTERTSSKAFVKPTYDEQKQMYPAGDYYGTGFKAPLGKIRESSPSREAIPQKSFRKAPKSLA